jgi:4-alpha-glucanotransferase
VHPESYDVWRERDAFAFPASVGAPPDMFFAKGQNWGFPPLNPERLRAQGYRHFLDYLRFQMRCTGLLRIDHIMGFHRLYWIPPGFPPTQGAYVTYPAEELHALLSLESHRHKTILVGENLGTVPPEVDAAMAKHHLRETYVLQYQTRLPPGPSLHQPPVRSVASLNTHDMPTFAAHWRGLDLEDRVALGLLPARDVPKQMARRKKMNTALLDFLKRKGWLDSEKILPATALRACLKWLAASPAETLLFNLEDLWLEQQPQNVPGTSFERPNWRQKARLSIEQIRRSAELRELLRTINELRGDGRKAGGEVTSPPVHLQGRHQ